MLNRSINALLFSFIAILFLAPSADAAGTKTITRGQSAVINWNVTGAPSCSPDTNYPSSAGDGVASLWSGAGNNTTGSVTFPSVYTNGTFSFSCTDLNSGISDSATLIVNDCTSPQVWNGTACVAPPTASITQDTTSTVQGTSFYISWSSTNASSCTVTYSGPLTGTLSSGPTSGGPVEMNPGTAGTYTATNSCTNSAGQSASQSVSHEVTTPSSCALPWGGSISNGQSVTAYQASSVVSPATCVSETRTCNNGTLSGSYANQTCTVTAAAQPDLTAGAVSPTSATAGSAVTLSATITNSGSTSTGSSFNNFIQVATASNGGGTITDLASASMTTLAAGASNTTSGSYTFSTAGTYSVRACADKSDRTSAGSVAESNENNNCGAWTDVTVSAPAGPSFIDIFFN